MLEIVDKNVIINDMKVSSVDGWTNKVTTTILLKINQPIKAIPKSKHMILKFSLIRINFTSQIIGTNVIIDWLEKVSIINR